MASCSPPSRTLRAAQARWPSAILDRGCARRLGMVRPGRRNGPFQPNQETSQVGRAVPHGKGSAVASTHAKRRGGKNILWFWRNSDFEDEVKAFTETAMNDPHTVSSILATVI